MSMRSVRSALFALILSMVSGAAYAAGDPFVEAAQVKPGVKPYTVSSGLRNVQNRSLFTKLLNSRQKQMIGKNAFVVVPSPHKQLFYIYEENEYVRPNRIPAFITTDSMLHTYHVFYDYALRKVESEKLYDILVKLTDAMLEASEKDLAAASGDAVKNTARRNVAFFSVAAKLLGAKTVPQSGSQMAQADLAMIADHQGRATSASLGVKMDFSQFIPRGHYTRTEQLKRYFKAMMWYGLAGFPVPEDGEWAPQTRQALLITRALRNTAVGKSPALTEWEKVYEPTAFFVGKADDLTAQDYARLSDQVYGKNPSVDDFADEAKLEEFAKLAQSLRGPGIENFVAVSPSDARPDPKFPTGKQFRFMGQRFIPDSRVLQELTHPKVTGRNFPTGLDVMAALGSDRALQLASKQDGLAAKPGPAAQYATQMKKMRAEFGAAKQATWQSNLYWGWLWSLKSIVTPMPKGYPSFMRNDAWLDKSLFSALGSWTELRHDTILYGKQSVAEMGGEEEELSMPKGYVEPNLWFWTKLQWLNSFTRSGLAKRDLLSEELDSKFETMGIMIDFNRKISIKELTGQKMTRQEYEQMTYYGAELEGLTTSFADGGLLSDADKDMALVADVHTSFGSVLEEATGRAATIYVVVPIEGKLYLTRGAVFTHYEFVHPASDRLTDEKWQSMLNKGKAPALAKWVGSFFAR